MRRKILAILGSALIVLTSVQFAAAAQRGHVKAAHAVPTRQQSPNTDAYAAWPAPAARPDDRYPRGFSAPAGY
ncbi:hypothetical protein UP10_37330 [Bradyrhizobium sp. LTSPM299]|uniref:hypothetical protein n=1 Tax=Bradyrhizobium sp. LTSPM299 TaxID=1619233 RepID=UPI0005C8AAF0|nr:hypothetical protein [Bradyrhizobium sp. LTSPM299]KJC56022.1 hypothetical protein UP10_37330 [Bradyrhizobium sp. LTSPM299]